MVNKEDIAKEKMNDLNAHDINEAVKIIAGSAGVFSTAPDLLLFLEEVLKGKMGKIALGWETGRKYMGEHCEKRIGKTGFTGSVIIVDFEQKKGIVILSNYTYPKRKSDLPKGRNDFFKKISDVVFG